MDAACMSSDGRFSGIACVSDVDHLADMTCAVLLFEVTAMNGDWPQR